MTPIYQQNINSIRNRWPDIAELLDSCSFDGLEFEVLEKRSMTLRVNGVQLSSAYDPIEEAFQYRSLVEGDNYHIWGIGMGNVPSLLAQDNKMQSVTIFLYNLPLAKLVLTLIPQLWLSDPRFKLVTIDESAPQFIKHLASISWPSCIIINADKTLSRSSHQSLVFRMENRIITTHANVSIMRDDEEFERIENENTPLLSRVKSLDTYLLYEIKDAICIGAGPSLQHHIDELKSVYQKENRPKFIAAATACKCLLENGIKPDVVFAIDINIPSSYIPFHIAKNTILVFASRMPARIFQNWQGEKYYCHLGDFSYDRFSEILPSNYRPFSFGSVIHPLIHCTLLQGAERISLIGCDFGFPGNIIHAAMENDPNDPHTTMTARVENGFGQLIKTSPAYRMFGTGVEHLISAYSNTTFYNWSRIGAKIFGTEYLELEKVYGHPTH